MKALELNNRAFGATNSAMPPMNGMSAQSTEALNQQNKMDINSLETEMGGLVNDMKKMLNDVGQMEFSPHLFKDVLDEMKDLPKIMEKTIKDAKKISRKAKGKRLPRKKVAEAIRAARVGPAVQKRRPKRDDEDTDDLEGDDPMESDDDQKKQLRKQRRQ